MAQRPRCDRCGSRRLKPVLYGYPSPEATAAADAGRIALGGCEKTPDSPDWECRVCRRVDGRQGEWTGRDGPLHGEFADFHRPLTTATLPSLGSLEVSEFALSFDGHAAFPGTLWGIAGRNRKRFFRSGRLPDNLAVLRVCLFVEQRIAHQHNTETAGPFVDALVEKIGDAVRQPERVPDAARSQVVIDGREPDES